MEGSHISIGSSHESSVVCLYCQWNVHLGWTNFIAGDDVAQSCMSKVWNLSKPYFFAFPFTAVFLLDVLAVKTKQKIVGRWALCWPASLWECWQFNYYLAEFSSILETARAVPTLSPSNWVNVWENPLASKLNHIRHTRACLKLASFRINKGS